MSTTQPPGPRGHFLLGNLPDFRRDVLGFLTRCAREYGGFASFRLGPRRCVLLTDPALIEEVFVTRGRHFHKHFGARLLRPLVGNGLLTSEGDFWLRQRRLIQPAFQRGPLAGYAATMVRCAEELLSRWADGQTRDLHADMSFLTMRIAARIFFGADVGHEDEVGAALLEALVAFDRQFRGLLPLPSWVPTPSNLRMRRAVRRLDALIYPIIKQRRADAEPRADLLSRLLRARDEQGGQMTDVQVRDEVMTLFLAGHETTALALSWALYLLARHPDAEAKLLDELASVLPGRSPTAEDLPRLRYTAWVVDEAMRLYPPAYLVGRQPVADCTIGGHPVRAGTTVFLSQWVTHRDPRFFPDPERFHPERWDHGLMERLPKFAYFPFGGGPRVCIGNTFALMEAALVLATLLPRYAVTLDPGYEVTPWPSVTLRPRHGVRAVVRRR